MNEYDEYDEAIAYLLSQEDFRAAVEAAWNYPFTEGGGILFRYCSPDGYRFYNEVRCGCLTQVKEGSENAYTEDLTYDISLDPWLPSCLKDVTPESLEHFARWQRYMRRVFAEMEK